MADKKLSDLTALPTVADGDLLYTLDVSDSTDFAEGSSRKATVSQLSAKVRGDIVEGDIPAEIARDSEVTAAIDALDAAITAALALKADLVGGTVPSAQLPIASAGSLGAIRVGSNLSIDGSGILSAQAGMTSPASFTFTDQTGVSPSSVVTSNTVTLAGGSTVNDTWLVTVDAAAGSPEVSINGGTWTQSRVSAAVARAGDTIRVRVTSSNLVLTARTVTVRVGGHSTTWTVTTVAWSPSQLTSLVFWLSADPQYCFQDAGASVPCGDGDPVYTWADRSGNNKHFVQSTLGSRPKLRSISGKWLVRCDGVDDKMLLSHTFGSGSWTLSLALAVPAISTPTNRVVQGLNADGLNIDISPGGIYGLYRGQNPTGGTYSSAAHTLVAKFLSNGSGSLRKNGSEIISATVGTDAPTELYLAGGTSGHEPEIDVYGFIGVNADVSGTDLTELETYLANLYT